MRQITTRILATSAISALAFSVSLSSPLAQTSQAPSFEIEGFIGRITVTNNEEITVRGENDGTVSREGRSWRVSGDEEVNVTNCRERNSRVELSFGDWSWRGRSGGYKNIDEYPHLKITLPPNTHLIISDSVIYGDIDRIGSADIHMPHCSDLVVGDITGALDLTISGSADLAAQSIGEAQIKVRGSGDVSVDDIGPLSLNISGSGDFEAESVTGNAIISVNGSGDVEIDDLTGDLDYRSHGSGDLNVDDLQGERLTIDMHGSGDVEIDSGNVSDAELSAHGSGDISYGGAVKNITVKARGSSNTYVKKASGDINVDVTRSSDVRVNGKDYGRN